MALCDVDAAHGGTHADTTTCEPCYHEALAQVKAQFGRGMGGPRRVRNVRKAARPRVRRRTDSS